MSRNAAQDKQIRQNVDDIRRLQLSVDPDGDAVPREFINHIGANARRLVRSMRSFLSLCVRAGNSFGLKTICEWLIPAPRKCLALDRDWSASYNHRTFSTAQIPEPNANSGSHVAEPYVLM